MLMAVVLCLTLCTGAFAASGEIETAAPEEITELVADGQPSETPAEPAAPTGQPADVPQPMSLDDAAADAPVPMDGVTSLTQNGVVIEGFGGTVTYGNLGGYQRSSGWGIFCGSECF